MEKIEAQRVRLGQKYQGHTVTAIRKLLLIGKSAVILKCEGNISFTLPAEREIVVSN